MSVLSGWILGVPFAVALGFFFYGLAERNSRLALWSGFVAFVCAALATTFLIDSSLKTGPTSKSQALDSVARPWITIASLSFHINEGKPLSVTLEFRNTGSVPAADIVQKWRTGIQTMELNIGTMPPLRLLPDSILSTLPRAFFSCTWYAHMVLLPGGGADGVGVFDGSARTSHP